jgi:hypothetical protein
MSIAAPRVDHIVLDTRDRMDHAVAVYRSLGFHLTERSKHTLGSINHLAVFESDYLELLGFSLGQSPRADIASFPIGLNGLVFSTESADDLFQEIRRKDLPVEQPQTFSRPVNLSEGVDDARFRAVRFKDGGASFGRVYFCQHLTPSLVWRREWEDHPNGATALTRVSIAARCPYQSAEVFRLLFGQANVSCVSGAICKLLAGTVEIELHDAGALQSELGVAAPSPSGRNDFIARVGIRTSSLRQTAEVLRSNAVPFHAGPARVLVPAAAAFNVAIEFTERVS